MPLAYRISGNRKVRLKDYDPDDSRGLTREGAAGKMEELGAQIAELNDLLFAASRHSLLIILQGRDTSGKDGLIRRLLTYINAQSCRVVPFKAPTAPELTHDFLWRVHSETPGRGSIALFNRSHYEDVLIARVHDLVPEPVWRRRYDHINAFESALTDANTIIVKCYLHISKDEQEKRLMAREADATKAWKLSLDDWREREFWDAYTEAYEDVLQHCAPRLAPWHVVPANRKWFRDVAVMEAIVAALKPYRAEWLAYLEQLGDRAVKELREFRETRGKT